MRKIIAVITSLFLLVEFSYFSIVFADSTTTFTFGADSQSWVYTDDSASCSGAFTSGVGNAAGSLQTTGSKGGGAINCNTYWEWSGTWEDLGVTAGDTVTGISGSYDYAVSNDSSAGTWSTGAFELRNSAGTLRETMVSSLTGQTGTAAFTNRSGTNQTFVGEASTTSVKLRLNTGIQFGGGTRSWTGQVDNISITIVHSAGGAPSTYTQNDFEWFVTADSVTLSNAWPPGNGEDISENTALTQIPLSNAALDVGDKIRIQMNFTVGDSTLSASSQAFKLQYDAAEDCTTASGWTAVGAKASGSIWRLFDESSIGDSTAQVNNISTSSASAEGYYSEINASAANPNEILATENSEWDWPVENNGAASNTTYCFRMVLSDDTPFDAYNADSYPKLTTAPGMSDVMRHGNFFQNSIERGFFWES